MARELIYCPDIHRNSFVLLFAKGLSGESWSIRDYSAPNTVSVRYAAEFPFSYKELQPRIQHRLPAPSHLTDDVSFWREEIERVNAAHGIVTAAKVEQGVTIATLDGNFPLLNENGLYALPKAAKASDMRRIFTSPKSEDWVTWNTFALIQQLAPGNWWTQLLSLAQKDNPHLLIRPCAQTPTVSLWHCISSPATYELASRARMAASGNADWKRRALSAKPVEGESEIDIILRSAEMTLFIEAKLGSDVSLSTTYDPYRNQIARNIDCLLETCGTTQPLFWMMVRDRSEARYYTRLMRQYRNDPQSLAQLLPHRSLAELMAVTANGATILWSEILSVLESTAPDAHTESVRSELHRRTLARALA